MLCTGDTTHGANSALFKSMSYDPVSDFDAITPVGVFPLVLMPRAHLGVRSVLDTVASIPLIRNNKLRHSP